MYKLEKTDYRASEYVNNFIEINHLYLYLILREGVSIDTTSKYYVLKQIENNKINMFDVFIMLSAQSNSFHFYKYKYTNKKLLSSMSCMVWQ